MVRCFFCRPSLNAWFRLAALTSGRRDRTTRSAEQSIMQIGGPIAALSPARSARITDLPRDSFYGYCIVWINGWLMTSNADLCLFCFQYGDVAALNKAESFVLIGWLAWIDKPFTALLVSNLFAWWLIKKWSKGRNSWFKVVLNSDIFSENLSRNLNYFIGKSWSFLWVEPPPFWIENTF